MNTHNGHPQPFKIIVIFGVTPIILFEYFNDIIRTKRRCQQKDLQSLHPYLIEMSCDEIVEDGVSEELESLVAVSQSVRVGGVAEGLKKVVKNRFCTVKVYKCT